MYKVNELPCKDSSYRDDNFRTLVKEKRRITNDAGDVTEEVKAIFFSFYDMQMKNQ